MDEYDYNYEIEMLENDNQKLKEDIEWYKMWHNKFKRKIEKLQTELETYRPTKLEGNGQCSCYGCEQKKGFNRIWTSFCYKYKCHIYCSDCLQEILEKEKNNAEKTNN